MFDGTLAENLLLGAGRTPERIEAALQETGGNKSAAAQRLGLSLRQLQYRLQVLASN